MSTRIGIVADLHYTNPKIHPGDMHNGVSARLRGMVDVLENAVTSLGLNVVIVAGDFFDSSRPNHVVAHYVTDRLHKGSFERVRFYVIPGNHDADSNAVYDHVLSMLEHSEGITPVHTPTLFAEHVWMVPWGYHPMMLKPPTNTKVVVAHHGIWGEATPSFMRNAKDAVSADEVLAWMNKHGVEYYYAGDWHEHASYHGGRVVQIGALTPQDWRNPGIHGYGTVVVIDNNEKGWSPPHLAHMAGPRFITAETSSALPKLPPGCKGYARVKAVDGAAPGYLVVEETGAGDEQVEQAERAAVDVSSFEQLGTSLENWVMEDASIPAEDRQEVYRRAMIHLRAGGAE